MINQRQIYNEIVRIRVIGTSISEYIGPNNLYQIDVGLLAACNYFAVGPFVELSGLFFVVSDLALGFSRFYDSPLFSYIKLFLHLPFIYFIKCF